MTDSHGSAEDKKIWAVLLCILLLFTGVILYARHLNVRRQEQAETVAVSRYTNYQYGIKLAFPPNWAPVSGYSYDRYEGDTGFFGISAIGGSEMGIDETAMGEARHTLTPYGSSPDIQALSVDGQEARLILPSPDQDPSMKGQAALVVEYPEAMSIGGENYRFFVLWADQKNIHYIASTLTFIREDE